MLSAKGGSKRRLSGLVKADIVGVETRGDVKPYTVYKIDVRDATAGWTIFRRYTHFLQLYSQLRAVIPLPPNFQEFPTKKLSGTLEPAVIAQRKLFFDSFLPEIVKFPHLQCVQEFLEHSPDDTRPGGAKIRKVAVVGFMAVGKSAVTQQFVNQHFEDGYLPTFESSFAKDVVLDRQRFTLNIIDTAGQDEYRNLHVKYTLGVHGYVLVYSVTNRKSFEMTRIINDKIADILGTNKFPKILVANKSDLDSERQVTTLEGQQLASDLGCEFVECSARLNRKVEEVFSQLIQQVERMSCDVDESAGGRSDKAGCIVS